MNQMDDLMQPEAWMYDWVCDGKLLEGWIAHKKSEIPRLLASNIQPLYTADQMREYAKKAVEAERVSLHITTEMLEAAAEEYDQWADENKGTYECIRAMLVKARRCA